MSFSLEGLNGRRQLPSQFIEEIDKKFKKEIDIELFEKKTDRTLLLRPGRKIAVPGIDDKVFLNSIVTTIGISD